MITAFHAQNLKGFVDVRTSLGPLTVLVGPNGAGKSTLLDGLHWLLQLARPPASATALGRAGELFQGRDQFASILRQPDSLQLLLEATLEGDGIFSAQLQANALRALETVVLQKDGASVGYPFHPGARDDFFEALRGADLDSVVRLNLDVEALATPSKAATKRPSIRPDGAGLPTLLQYLAGERDGRLERIEADLKQLVPSFRRVRMPPTTLQEQTTELVRFGQDTVPRTLTQQVAGYRLEVEFEGVGPIPAEHTSEGTLLALGLLTVLHADPPSMLLIDDADRALHPAAQGHLMVLLKALMRDRPALQVVLTTHSPDLVDACSPEEVRVLGRDDAGAPHIAELTAHPDAARWLKMMRVGEFWSTVGEGWVAAAEGGG